MRRTWDKSAITESWTLGLWVKHTEEQRIDLQRGKRKED
jgi:hypothetical protein